MNYPLILLALGLTIGALQFRECEEPIDRSSQVTWPTTFEGRRLEALPLSNKETAFARGFPGGIATFIRDDGSQVILRQADRATRRLHDSATCLRASGHRIGTRSVRDGWARYTASLNSGSWHVRARIENAAGDKTWTEISAWYWHALFYPATGPWRAVTVLEPM